IADKHGGRNRYQDFLPPVVDDEFIVCKAEGMDCSRYRVRNVESSFETKAERHFPVGLASMVSKYVRELAMILFNRYWAELLPGYRAAFASCINSNTVSRIFVAASTSR